MKRSTGKKWLYFLIGVTLIIYFFYFQNNALSISEYQIRSNQLPQSFNGYKIVQLSDLHSKSFGKNQSKLLRKIENVQPDVIVFTGDLVDSRRYNEKPSLTLMEQLVHIAPVYYVTGNHEWGSGNFGSLEDKLKNIGIHVMRNEAREITRGNDTIYIVGLDDPANIEGTTIEESIENSLKSLEDDHFKIVLSHRPEKFFLYAEYDLNIVFSGHAHGGQFRIPFVGGFIAPNQGFFPKYTEGKHTLGQTTMVVNRGLGNSIIPVRIFNRPEIVVATLLL